MAKRKTRENLTQYTYTFADGTEQNLHVGQDEITKEMILLLRDSDRLMALQDRAQEEHRFRTFEKALEWDEKEQDAEDLLERIPDPREDIWNQLFPEEPRISEDAEGIRRLMEKLTPAQTDLIFELYGLQKAITEIARAEKVTEAAIRNRRNKILQRLKKMLEEQKP